jgi:hypothetical protein
LILILFVFTISLELAILFAFFRALHKQLASEDGREDFFKFLIVLVLGYLLIAVISVAFEPGQFQVLPLPWHYLMGGLLALLLLGGLVWGITKHRWLNAFGNTIVSFVSLLFEGVSKFYQQVFSLF